jgi:ATP-dependent exoDNAse (exonuclease V) beta subunit
MNRIAFSGKMCSGKTTIAKMFEGYERKSLAEPFKHIANLIRQMTPENIMDKVIEIHKYVEEYIPVHPEAFMRILNEIILKDIISPDFDLKDDVGRKFLQDVGNEMRKRFYEDIWVDTLLNQLKPNGKYVVDDVRYPNEVKGLEQAGFIVIRFYVSPNKQYKRIKRLYGEISKERIRHESETALDNYPFKYIVNANGSIEEQFAEVKKILEGLDANISCR